MTTEHDALFTEPRLPGQPGCNCSDLAARVAADIADEPRVLCPQHEQPEIAARQAEQQRVEAEARIAKSRAEIDTIDPDGAERRRVTQQRDGHDPFTLQLAEAVGADPDPRKWGTNVIPIGDTKAVQNALDRALLGDANPDDPEGPIAA